MSAKSEQKESANKGDPSTCIACTARKSTCDGHRPRCKPCADQATECAYKEVDEEKKQMSDGTSSGRSKQSPPTDSSSVAPETSDGSSSSGSRGARNQVLHRLIAAIQTCDEEEVQRLVDTIRSSGSLDVVCTGIDMALETVDRTRLAQALERIQTEP